MLEEVNVSQVIDKFNKKKILLSEKVVSVNINDYIFRYSNSSKKIIIDCNCSIKAEGETISYSEIREKVLKIIMLFKEIINENKIPKIDDSNKRKRTIEKLNKNKTDKKSFHLFSIEIKDYFYYYCKTSKKIKISTELTTTTNDKIFNNNNKLVILLDELKQLIANKVENYIFNAYNEFF